MTLNQAKVAFAMKKELTLILFSFVLSSSILAQTYSDDSLIVTEILEINGLNGVATARFEDRTDSSEGRIFSLNLTFLNLDTLILPSNLFMKAGPTPPVRYRLKTASDRACKTRL